MPRGTRSNGLQGEIAECRALSRCKGPQANNVLLLVTKLTE